MVRVALITGVNGQDGSYLSELLLDKEYYVYGILRRTSLINTKRIDHLAKNPRFKTVHGDVTDLSNVISIIRMILATHPTRECFEIYNFAAQSHVKVSFEEPIYTANVDSLGTLNMLEAIRVLDLIQDVRFYQASTSELFGKVQEIPQRETTPFYPRSPYGVAKLYSYWIVKNYREGYKMHASNGILFNHETVAAFTPMIYKRSDGTIDIKPISEICRNESGLTIDESNKVYQEGTPTKPIEIWDKDGWTKVKYVSCYPHNVISDNKSPRMINGHQSAIMTTGEHVFFRENGQEVECKNIKVGDPLRTIDLPGPTHACELNVNLCQLLGALISHGYNCEGERVWFTSTSLNNTQIIEHMWLSIDSSNSTMKQQVGDMWHLHLNGRTNLFLELDIHNEDGSKRVPHKILNASPENMSAFLEGYVLWGSGQWDYIEANSAVLAQGLVYLMGCVGRHDVGVRVSRNSLTDYRLFTLKTVPPNGSNHVQNTVDCPNYDGWFYDLETESGTFHCGVGYGHVHNSPRRGETFLTRKVTIGVGKILRGEEECLYLGNLDSQRDWGHAKDYVRGMWMMLQQDTPDDYVLATGECYSVRQFCELAFNEAGIKLQWEGEGVNEIGKDATTGRVYVRVSEKYFRPTEVDLLWGDATKAKEKLGWVPTVPLGQLVKEMVAHDLENPFQFY
jgi:GDPmannose 4,6-dehydratase